MSNSVGQDLFSAGMGSSQGVLLTQPLSAISPSTISQMLKIKMCDKIQQSCVPLSASTSRRASSTAERNQQISKMRAAAKRTPTPKREDLRQEHFAKEDALAYDESFPWVIDLEFSLEDCDRIFGGAHVLLDDTIACHEFAISVATSVRNALLASSADLEQGAVEYENAQTIDLYRSGDPLMQQGDPHIFQGVLGVMHLGVGTKLVRIPTGAYRRQDLLLVQLRTTPASVTAREPESDDEWGPDVVDDLGERLVEAVDQANIRGSITITENEDVLRSMDDSSESSFQVSIGATVMHDHGVCATSTRRQSSSSVRSSPSPTCMTRSLSLTGSSGSLRSRRPSKSRAHTPATSRAPALARTKLPSFAQHAIRIPLDHSIAHHLQHLVAARRQRARDAETRRMATTRARADAQHKANRREARNHEEQRRIADREHRRAERVRQAELEVALQKLQKKREKEDADHQRVRQERARKRAEEEHRQAMEQAARERAHRAAVLEEENRVLHEQERSERTTLARERTLQNIDAMRDAVKRQEAMLQFRQEAEWELHCRTIRAAGDKRYKQGIAAIRWGGTGEAEQQRMQQQTRAERTEAAREKSLANVRQQQSLEFEQRRAEFATEYRERQEWEHQLRQTNAANKVLGQTAIELAQREKAKIDAQNQRYAEGRARIAASKEESRKRFEEKQAREAAEAAQLAAVEKIRVKEHRLQRERERQRVRENAKIASEKEMHRVARQEIRRQISALPKPQSQADWHHVVELLVQKDSKISSKELDFFCNGPKHRDFIKWYRTKYIADVAARDTNNKRAWLGVSDLRGAVEAYAIKTGLPKQTELSADELLRQEESHRSTSPSKRWIPPG